MALGTTTEVYGATQCSPEARMLWGVLRAQTHAGATLKIGDWLQVFDDLLRMGLKSHQIDQELRRPDRVRSESPWEFRRRLWPSSTPKGQGQFDGILAFARKHGVKCGES
jgi:hypothetical protein